MTLYHGGAYGLNLQPGDLILPPTETGAEALRDLADEHAIPGAEVMHRDRVYVTTDQRAAAMFAAMRATADSRGVGGDVYEVEALGPLHHDPDYHGPRGVSFETTRARVVRVTRRRVPVSYGLAILGL